MGKFKFEPVPSEALEKATQKGGDYDSYMSGVVKFVKVDEGEHTFRVMPRTWDAKQFGPYWYVEGWIHRDIGPDKGSYLCPLKMNGDACPLCEAIAELDSESDKEYIDKIRAKIQYFAYIIDRSAPKDGVKAWRFGVKLRRNLTMRCQDKKTKEWLQISDPDEGYDISFRRTGQGLGTEYVGEEVDRDSSPLSEKATQQEAWMQFVIDNPLPEQFVFQEYEYLEKVFRGKGGTKQDRADDAADRAASGATRGRGRAQTQEPEEEEEDNGEEAEAAEHAARTKPKVAPKKKALEPVDSDLLLKMDDEELTILVQEYGLDIDVADVPVKKLRREVIAALEEKNLLKEDDEITQLAKPNGKTKPAAKEDDDDEGDGEGGVVAQAKKSLERIRPGRR